MTFPHQCDPGQWCAVCDHNVRVGGTRNHPSAPRRPAAKPAEPARVSLPCAHQGEPLTGLERAERKLDHARRWTWCGHPDKPLGEAVCACRGCNSSCRGYSAEPAPVSAYIPPYDPPPAPPYGVPPIYRASALPRWHPVPPPAVRPTRPRLVVTLVVGDDAEELHRATGPGQRRYAERVGADYLVLRGETQDRRTPCGEKWRYKDYVPHYPGGTLCVDADVWVAPDAPDIFAATPADAVGMVDVLPRTPNLRAWFPPKVREVCDSQGVPCPPLEPRYWNSGVWVGRPEHAAYWEPPARPFPVDWCVEEMWCRVNCHRHGLRVHDLDPRFNWTWIEDRTLARVGQARPWFWHFAGMGNAQAESVPEWRQPNRAWRLALLRLLAAVA